MQGIIKGHGNLQRQLRDINPVGRILLGVILLLIGVGWLYVSVQIRAPLIILAIGGAWALAGGYGIFTGMRDIPDERHYSQVITVEFTQPELMALMDVVMLLERFAQRVPEAQLVYARARPIGFKIQEVVFPDPANPERQLGESERATITQLGLEWATWAMPIAAYVSLKGPTPPPLVSATQKVLAAMPASARAEVAKSFASHEQDRNKTGSENRIEVLFSYSEVQALKNEVEDLRGGFPSTSKHPSIVESTEAITALDQALKGTTPGDDIMIAQHPVMWGRLAWLVGIKMRPAYPEPSDELRAAHGKIRSVLPDSIKKEVDASLQQGGHS